MSIARVIEAWKAGESLRSGNVSTDGHDICSWRLRIGRTRGSTKIAFDYRGQVSGATSRHCGLVIASADAVEPPPKVKR
jgi:hypothetical protein